MRKNHRTRSCVDLCGWAPVLVLVLGLVLAGDDDGEYGVNVGDDDDSFGDTHFDDGLPTTY